MSYDNVIPYTSSINSKYLISFKEIYGTDFSLPIVDISIVLVEKSDSILPLKDLISISRIIKTYMDDKNLILYYYCDSNDADIFISPKNKLMKPQEFRSKLFNALFDRMQTDDYVKDEIIIEEPNSTHYISLITKSIYKSSLTEVSYTIQQMNDK